MGIKNDVFGLEQIYQLQIEGQWSTKADVWNPPNPFSGKYNFSYVAAGMNNDSPGASDASGYKNRIEKYDFASDTTSILNDNANLDHNSSDAMGRAYVSSPENQYTIGGGNYFLYANAYGIFKTSYANGTSRSLAVGGMNPDIKCFMGASVNNTSHGYFTRGGTWYDSNSTTNYRIDFSNDYATTVEKGPLTQARKSLAGVGNQSYGYFGGGKGVGSTPYLAATTGYSNVDRLDYSSDSTAMSPKGPLSGARGYVAATGNASYGYFVGGGSATNSNVSTIDRIDYASDTSTASPKGPMTAALWGISASGTPSYGYIFGGSTNAPSSTFGYNPSDSGNYPSNSWRDQADNAKSYVQRIDFSNDTATLSPRGNLQRKIYLTGSTSSQSNANTTPVTLGPNEVRENVAPQGTDFGYFGGGDPASSKVYRIDYGNDTATASPKGPLSAGRYTPTATGSANHGYFAGGISPGPTIYSTIDRIDYSNDTADAVVKGPLSVARGRFAATGNASFGYFGGGDPNPLKSTVDRVDYSNDTATASPKGPLDFAKRELAATGNQNFGYFAGGDPGNFSTVQRIDYSNDTGTAAAKGPLSVGRMQLAATGNASFGYFGGGDPGPKSTVDRIDYSNDTATAAAKGPLSLARDYLSATGNSSFGYFGGGGPGAKSTVDRIDYSNDTATASVRGSLIPSGAARQAACSSRANAIPLKGPGILEVSVSFGTFSRNYGPQGTDFGYFGGGYPAKSTIERIDYSNDTATASAKGPLSLARYSLGATGNSSFGYFGGGYTSSNVSTVDRINYSNDSVTAPARGPLSGVRRYLGTTSTQSFGYFGGGYDNIAPTLSTVDRIDYNNDTATASPKGPLSVARYELAATGNQSFGYFAGGGPGPKSTVDRIDYSNDTATAAVKGQLSAARWVVSATGNASFGYYGGGGQPGVSSKVDRIDYSNDTATSVEKGPLSIARESMSATGNQSFGYFAGGYTPTISTIDRIDYSNDTAIASARGPLTEVKGYTAATSSRADGIPTENIINYAAGTIETHNTGYFVGGEPGPAVSTVDRIDYSNDTASASVKGPLSVATTLHAGTGNSFFGYFGGGSAPSTVSTVQRIDYSNDTPTALAKGPLSLARDKLAATGNASFGYFGGGNPGPKSTIDRIDYSNDTGTAPAKGPLSSARKYLSATGNAFFGYFGGGNSPGTESRMERIDYSNDTANASPKGPLSVARNSLSATGNASFGYFGGGYSSTHSTTVDRIDYSNDTATAVVKGPLSDDRAFLGATSARANGFAAVGPSISSNLPTISPSSATPQNYGYTLAGNPIVRWSFSNDNDVAVMVNNNPAHEAGGMSGMVSSTTHGYWNRQYSNSPQIYRLDYANDTVNPVQVGSLSSNKTGAGAVHNADYGYWTGGIEYPGGSSFNATSSVQRLDFSNDSANAVAKGNLSHAIKEHRGVGNMDKGYLFKGSILTRIDYSNDTATSTSIGTGGPNTYQGEAGGAGNLNYGWLFGYKNPSTPSSSPGYGTYSGILRLDYANDTGTLSPRGPLLIGGTSRSNGATGNRDQGYFHGGFNGGGLSSVMNKVVYANDTVTAQFKKALFLCPAYTFYDGNSFSAAQNGLPQ